MAEITLIYYRVDQISTPTFNPEPLPFVKKVQRYFLSLQSNQEVKVKSFTIENFQSHLDILLFHQLWHQ